VIGYAFVGAYHGVDFLSFFWFFVLFVMEFLKHDRGLQDCIVDAAEASVEVKG